MKRWPFIILGLASLLSLTSLRAVSSSSLVLPTFIQLQAATPGVQEVGHANISGTLKVGKVHASNFQLGTTATPGTVLTSNASGVGTWQAPSMPLPWIATIGTSGSVLSAKNTIASNGTAVTGEVTGTAGVGVRGTASSVTGGSYGGWFVSSGNTGVGVAGEAISSTGTTIGGTFSNRSPSGSAVRGVAATTTGNSAGGYFSSTGLTGSGVTGESRSATGSGYGGYFTTLGKTGIAVFGSAESATGATIGGYFESNSTTGRGLYANAAATTGAGALPVSDATPYVRSGDSAIRYLMNWTPLTSETTLKLDELRWTFN